MTIFVIIGLGLLALLLFAAFLYGFVIFTTYAIASGIAYKNETDSSAWDYWEMMKTKQRIELSDEEKEKLIIANLVIADDLGRVVTKEQLVKMLEEQLPVIEPNVGLSYQNGTK